MPPRYAYWTIIVDNQPTAFRSGSQEELMPTFKRLKAKNDSAVMMWWQHGKLWPSRVDAQEAMIAGREAGRRADERQTGAGFRDRERKPSVARTDRDARPEWRPKFPKPEAEGRGPRRSAEREGGLDWKPKGAFVPAPKRADRAERPERSDWKSKDEKPAWKPKGSFDRKPDWKPKSSFDREERPRSFKRPDFKSSGDSSRSAKPEWKPKGSFDRERKSEWKPKASFDRERKSEWKPKAHKSEADGRGPGRSAEREGRPEWKPKGSFEPQPRRPRTTERPDWTPKSGHTGAQPSEGKRKWVPKEEYKKSMGIEARRDSKWRPGGEHKDPKQKYKDAKKAKWTKFKQNIRARSGGKGKKLS